jgi:hypothetical protein
MMNKKLQIDRAEFVKTMVREIWAEEQRNIDRAIATAFKTDEEMKIDDMKERGYIHVFEEVDTGRRTSAYE